MVIVILVEPDDPRNSSIKIQGCTGRIQTPPKGDLVASEHHVGCSLFGNGTVCHPTGLSFPGVSGLRLSAPGRAVTRELFAKSREL